MTLTSLGTYGRTNASINIGSAGFARAGSSSRVAAWLNNNPPPMPGSIPYVKPNDGGYGGGGGAGASQYKANTGTNSGNGYSGGDGGQGLVCIWADINDTNETGSISGIPASPQPTIPAPSPVPSAILNVMSQTTNNISYTNSAYSNNTRGSTSVQYNGATYYVIYLGPGTFQIQTNLSIINIAMCGAGGGGAGGPSLENDSCLLGGAGGGGGGVIAGTIYLYPVNGNNFGLTSTIEVSIGYGGPGGQCGFSNPGNGQNYSGYGGGSGDATQVTITQSSPYAQFTTPLYLGCCGGGGGQGAPGNTSNNNGLLATGGAGGCANTLSPTTSLNTFSANGQSYLYCIGTGGNGGNGSNQNTTGNELEGNSVNITTGYPYQTFVVPAANCTIPYSGSSTNSSTTASAINAAAINMGGGGGGCNSYLNATAIITGGQGAGGQGGAVNESNYNNSPNILMQVFDFLQQSAIGDLGVEDPATYVSLIFDD